MQFINYTNPVYGKEEIKAVNDYLKSGGWLTEHKKTREFERIIAEFTGAKYCSVVSNGTVSLFLALKVLNIGPGDEVIVPDITMSATPNAAILAGAKVVFVDIEKDSLCLDVEKVEKAITKKTKAVMHVSLGGRSGELDKLKKLCRKNRIYLIEDAAQSLGSFYQGKHLGTHGIVGSISFAMPKIITTGQGGCLITNNAKIYKEIKYLRDFGRAREGSDFYKKVGWNFKFTDLQAVIGIVQMKSLRARMAQKKKILTLYKKLLTDVKEVRFIKTDLKQTTPYLIEILVPKREGLIIYLKKHNIGSRLIYPALHSQSAYKLKADCPVAEKIAKECLLLPSSISLTEKQIEYICNKIKEFYHGGKN